MKVVIAEGAAGQSQRLAAIVSATWNSSVVALASNGAEAIRAVLEEQPDVLILGAWFDPQDGVAVLDAVRPRVPGLRVVAVGDRPSGEFRRAFLLGDIDLLLARPDQQDEIREVLQRWQDEKRASSGRGRGNRA